MVEWIGTLQNAISAAFTLESQSPLGKEYTVSRFKERLNISPMTYLPSLTMGQDIEDNQHNPVQLLRSLCGNERCADCNGENPEWASVNMGTLLCIECTGIHRGLGVHISKVKSLNLDKWEPLSLQVSSNPSSMILGVKRY
jgi:hypothetical protein